MLEMGQTKPEKTRVVVAEMLVLGSASIYFIQQVYPGGGFVRDLLAVTITGLISSAFSVTLEKAARRKYLITVSVLVTLLLLTFCWVKVALKTCLAEAFAACKFSVVEAGTPIYPSDGNFKYITEPQQRWSEYWKNY